MSERNAYPEPVDRPLRLLVRHWHPGEPKEDGSPGPREDVVVSYSCQLPDAMMYAVSTASRYEGIIYADYGDGPYEFIRSFKPKRAVATPTA